MNQNNRCVIKSIYIVMFWGFLVASVILFTIVWSIKVAEASGYFNMAINLYNFGKIFLIYIGYIWLQFLIFYLVLKKVSTIKSAKKSMLHFVSLLLIFSTIPIYFNVANGEVPKRFEKLNIVQLIHDGEFEKAERIDRRSIGCWKLISYSGGIGHQDVLFRSKRVVEDDNHNYFNDGYLYSEDDRMDTSVGGMYDILEMKYIGNNWYQLYLILDS